MKKHKVFTSLKEEEEWINQIQSQGYQLVKVNPWLASYHFEKCDTTPKLVRLDFHEHISKSDYPNYLTLFSDSGWTCIPGSMRNGTHYFQQTSQGAGLDIEIFSDIASRKAFYQRYQNFANTYFIIFIALFFLYYQTGLRQGYHIWQPKSWYLTPGLWERQGGSFWFGFLFETPFALLRSGIISLLFLALAIYYLQIAQKVKKELKQIESD